MLDIRKARVLLVEESEALRTATVDQLRAVGVEHLEAVGDGANALQAMREQPFDVVLSGWKMPVMDGLALLRAMRADDRLANVGMVMITGAEEPEQVRAAIEGGVSDLLIKPYTRRQLRSKIVGEPDEPPPGPGDQTLLVVDDTPANLEIVSRLFEGQYRIRAANNGQRALDICMGDDPPDLVLLDVMMPGIDGFEVARRLRGHPSSEHIPVVFVTALADGANKLHALGLGAIDFVVKPIDPDVLQLRVRNFMRHVAWHKRMRLQIAGQLAAARVREDIEEVLRHDLRNPLSGALGFAQLLAREPGLAPDHGRMAQLIEGAARQALDILQMTGQLIRIESGQYRLVPERVDLAALLHEAAGLAVAWKQAKSIDIAVDAPRTADGGPWALGDAALCRSVIHNLLRNACEAAPSGSRVEIALRPAEDGPEGGRIELAIRNAGVVPPEVRERFFERYVTTGKRGGSGLGTYSARLLVQAQGGDIEMVTSDAANTTTLTARMPRFRPEIP